MPSYKITEVRVEVRPGLFITAEASGPADVKLLLEDLQNQGLFVEPAPSPGAGKPPLRQPPAPEPNHHEEAPEARLATRASIPLAILRSAKILAYKDGNPQLLRPSIFGSVSDATLSLLYATEVGLKKSSVAYDDFKALFEAQNIKSGTPLPMLLSNLHKAGYIDKKAYSTDRTVRLTAKGERKAEEVVKSLCGIKQ